ncbi:MAG: hypothetical protein Q8M58_06535, partial [Anaerolineales bacterium]|nr:hypothetical protein [Anaerolineales bacterium]
VSVPCLYLTFFPREMQPPAHFLTGFRSGRSCTPTGAGASKEEKRPQKYKRYDNGGCQQAGPEKPNAGPF